MVPATVTAINGGADTPYCNITAETDHPMGEGQDGQSPTQLTLNARQVYSADALDQPDAPPQASSASNQP